jgi:small subunit ribosomal protein S13
LQKALTSFFGIGNHQCGRIMARYHIHPTAKIGELANRQVLELTTGLTHMKIENDLRREVLDNIRRLKDIGTYRGRRHAIGLPVRGQGTRTNVRCGSFSRWHFSAPFPRAIVQQGFFHHPVALLLTQLFPSLLAPHGYQVEQSRTEVINPVSRLDFVLG